MTILNYILTDFAIPFRVGAARIRRNGALYALKSLKEIKAVDQRSRVNL